MNFLEPPPTLQLSLETLDTTSVHSTCSPPTGRYWVVGCVDFRSAFTSSLLHIILQQSFGFCFVVHTPSTKVLPVPANAGHRPRAGGAFGHHHRAPVGTPPPSGGWRLRAPPPRAGGHTVHHAPLWPASCDPTTGHPRCVPSGTTAGAGGQQCIHTLVPSATCTLISIICFEQLCVLHDVLPVRLSLINIRF